MIEGCLLGGALGDSLGLSAEGMNAERIAKRWPEPLSHTFVFGRGMVSDDTEHAVITALSLIKHPNDPEGFARNLAWRLRFWFTGLPGGIGLATAKAIIRLWLGFPPSKSGVRSAGNGPTMRAPIIGLFFRNQPELRRAFVDASTRLTHTDPRAIEAARVVAEAAVLATQAELTTQEMVQILSQQVESEELCIGFQHMQQSIPRNDSVEAFSQEFLRRKGFVSGFAPESTAIALYAWLRHRNDFPQTIEACIRAGGDTDTVAFVAGSLAGIDTKPENMPVSWTQGLCDWPIQPSYLTKVAAALCDPARSAPFYPIWPLSLMRNVCFLLIVLFHGFRRLFPPY